MMTSHQLLSGPPILLTTTNTTLQLEVLILDGGGEWKSILLVQAPPRVTVHRKYHLELSTITLVGLILVTNFTSNRLNGGYSNT